MDTTDIAGAATILYLEGSTIAGSRKIYCCGYAASSTQRHSGFWPHTAFFCPHCGEVWGRAVYNYAFSYQPLLQAAWRSLDRYCPKHGGGNFLSDTDPLDGCDAQLLNREVAVLLLNHKEP